jgi:hypothetical protein
MSLAPLHAEPRSAHFELHVPVGTFAVPHSTHIANILPAGGRTWSESVENVKAYAPLLAAAPEGLALIQKVLSTDPSQFSSAAQFQSWCALIAKPYLASATGAQQ